MKLVLPAATRVEGTMTSAFRRDCSFSPPHCPAGFDLSLFFLAARAFLGFQGSEAVVSLRAIPTLLLPRGSLVTSLNNNLLSSDKLML